jgi:hypothetical protein
MKTCLSNFVDFRFIYNRTYLFYTLNDITSPKIKDYKIYILLNATAIDENTAQIIRKKADKNQAIVLWCYAPGFIKNGKFDYKNMEKTTGIPFDISMKETTISPKFKQSSILFNNSKLLPSYTMQPVFTPKGENLTIHATSNNKAIVAEKKVGNHTAIYSLIPFDNTFLRNLAKMAKVHIYSNSSDVLLANKEHLFIHASHSGMKKINLPNVYNVLDIEQNIVIFKEVRSFSIPMKKYDNKLFRLLPIKK